MRHTVPRPRPWGRPDLPERPRPTAARAQQPITCSFERATPEEAAEQAAERMEADAAAAEEPHWPKQLPTRPQTGAGVPAQAAGICGTAAQAGAQAAA
jgi:hypothetical protein